MSQLVFDQPLKLGIANIDQQHERFVGYINDTRDALERGDSKEEFLHILNQLMDYALVHFSTEEQLMQEFGYPQLADHRSSHHRTSDELFAFDLRLMAEDPKAAEAFLAFLSDWLRHHICVTDREVADWLKRQGCR